MYHPIAVRWNAFSMFVRSLCPWYIQVCCFLLIFCLNDSFIIKNELLKFLTPNVLLSNSSYGSVNVCFYI